MELMVGVGVSNRHVHLTKEVYDELFFEEPTILKELTQPGQFAYNETLKIKTAKNIIDNVRILGPLRDYNQVEISATDARILGLNPPIRKSGDLKESETITLVGPKGEVTLAESCIIANRHMHISSEEALKYGLNDDEEIILVCDNVQGGTMKAFVKVMPNTKMEVHLDTDNANAFGIKQGDIIKVIK